MRPSRSAVLPLAAALIALLQTVTGAQARPASGARAAGVDPGVFADLPWRSIGPASTSGRIDDFAVGRRAGSPDAIYVGTASGGVWKSVNGGISWEPVFDKAGGMLSIGAVAVAPGNPDIVWVGTGEANNRQSSSWGDGVYRSLDGGRTWQNMGLKETRQIARIVVDPTDPQVVYVAALGHLWGSNSERGVYRTRDGGASWTRVLYVDENTGATDLVIDPRDPRTLFAATYQRQRKAWGFNGGGPGSAIYRTRDGGNSWTKLTEGLPKGDKGRIGLDVFRADARTVYATVEAGDQQGGLFRSTDGGETWERMTTLNTRPMYYSQVRVDPRDRNRIYMLGSNRGFYNSVDGGRTFSDTTSGVHGEDHALWVDPDDGNHLIVGGDGGVSISYDAGRTWDFRNDMPIGQFYEVAVDQSDPYKICGGLQDNGLWCVASATRNRNGISNAESYNIGGGDGFYAELPPNDPNTVYIESQGGRATRVDLVTMERQAIAPVGPDKPPMRGGGPGGGGEGGAAGALRWNWDTPIVISSFDPSTIYMAANRVFRSRDKGVTWDVISPDLTTNSDRDTLKMMGATVPRTALSRHDGQSNYGSITSVGESPTDAKVLYTGSDDGQVYVTRDGGASWKNVTANVTGLPKYTYVSSVVPSRYAPGRVYATFDGHYNDDYRPFVYVSDDYGQTWRSIAAGLPETSVNRIREHPTKDGVLFVGHERGLDYSVDGGHTWTVLGGNFPPAPVDDIAFQERENSLVLGTHGRSIWVLDDMAPLLDVKPGAAAFVQARRGRLITIYNPQAWFGQGEFFAPNPELGAVITWYLPAAATGSAKVEISDASGAVLRTLEGSAAAGLNRAVWDMRLESPIADEPQQAEGVGGFGGSPNGPLVMPGSYHVSVTVPGRPPLRTDVRVDADPRVTFSDADRQARQRALLTLYSVQKSLGAARTAAASATSLLRALGTPPFAVPDAMRSRVASTTAALQRVQGTINGQLSGASGVARAIEGYSARPTADQVRQVDWAFDDATKLVADLNRVTQTDLPSLLSGISSAPAWPARPGAVSPPVRAP